MDTHEVTGTIREAAGKIEKTYGQVKDKARASQTVDNLRDAYETAGERASESWERVEELVQENPGTTIGVSLLVGAALGSLITYLSTRD